MHDDLPAPLIVQLRAPINVMSTIRHDADRLLGHLRLDREAPSLEYLNRIVREHQLRVPFETLTKLIDYEPGLRRGDFMPSFAEYVDRIVDRGAGGLCWTLARGLQVLLDDLGFDASLMYMDPGHCCVRVDLDGPYYADVGYAAPLFAAFPLFESFVVQSPRETFEYRVSGEEITVVRTPGPSKTLEVTSRRLEEFRDRIDAANDWTATFSFLHRLSYATYVDGVFTSLREGTLTRYRPGETVSQAVTSEDAPRVLADVFGADAALYVEAEEVHRRFHRSPEPL